MRLYLLLLNIVMTLTCHNSNGQSGWREIHSQSKLFERLKVAETSFSDDTTKVKVLILLAANKPNMTESETVLNQALKLATKIHWERGEYLVEYALGRTYNKHGAYIKALNRLFKALFLAEKKNDQFQQADCRQRIGDSYLMLKKYTKAIESYKISTSLFKRLGRSVEYIDCLNNLGLVYYSQNEYREALSIFQECMRNSASVRGTILEAGFLSNIASVYRNMGDLARSLHFFDRALEVYKLSKGSQNDLLAITLVEKARVHDLKGEFLKAIKLGNQAYVMNGKYYGNNLYVTEFLADTYFKIGDYRNAYIFNKRYFQAWEDAQKLDRDKQVEAIKFEYENKQNKVEIALLNKDIAQKAAQRRFLSAGLVILLLCLAGSFWSFRILKKKNLKIELQKQQLSRVSQELESMNTTLEEQVVFRTRELTEANQELLRKNHEIAEALYRGQNIERKRVASELHDNLGSTMSGLIWQLDGLVLDNTQPQFLGAYSHLVDRMREAYSEIRQISHNLFPADLERFGLIESLNRLITNLNHNNRILFTFHHDWEAPSISRQMQLELYAITMELLTNVTKHSKATTCSVELNTNGTEIVLFVCDNGIGYQWNSQSKKGGKGLMNIYERIITIQGSLEIASTAEGGTVIKIHIPLTQVQ